MMRLLSRRPQRSALRPEATSENSGAGTASTRNPKSKASAATSNAGPRFADVAGKHIRNGAVILRVSGIAFLLRVKRVQDRVGAGFEHDRRFPSRRRQLMKSFVRHARHREVSPVKP